MPKRHVTHVKETIACRRFESALDPMFLVQPVHQGGDYGTDYFISIFDRRGDLVSRFGAQVKYIPPTWSMATHLADTSRLLNALDGYSYIDTVGINATVARYRLSLEHLNEYMGPMSAVPTLFVLANDQEFFYFWINDLFDCYLRWLPQGARRNGTLTIAITNLRSINRILSRRNGRMALSPVHKNYDEGTPTYLLKLYFGDKSGWLGSWATPRSVDSYSNLGFSLYVQNMATPGRSLRSFDVAGFWEHVILIRQTLPYALFSFSRFIGLLAPTLAMEKWAHTIIKIWQSEFDLPVAFQILAAANTEESRDVGLRALTNRFPHGWWRDFEDLTDSHDAWQRFLNEYIVGICHFLASGIKNSRSLPAQRMLIDLCLDFPAAIDVANPLVTEIAELILAERLTEDQSYSRLRRVCEISVNDPPNVAARKVRAFDENERRKYEARSPSE